MADNSGNKQKIDTDPQDIWILTSVSKGVKTIVHSI